MARLAKARGASTNSEQYAASWSGHLMWLGPLCYMIITVVAAAMLIWQMRDTAVDSYQRETKNLGVALAEQTSRYMQVVDLGVQALQHHIRSRGISTPEQFQQVLGDSATHYFLRDRLQNLPQANAFVLIDSAGRLINSSRAYPMPRIDLSDRDYFRHFAMTNEHGLYVSTTMTSRVAGTKVMFLARRINAPDGRFLGVAGAVVDIPYLNEFYHAVTSVPGQAVTLLRRDGLILARYPDPGRTIDRRIARTSPWYARVAASGGSFRSAGHLDGLASVVSVHPVGGFPLVVDVSIHERVALATWRRQAILIASCTLAALATFALLLVVVVVQFRRQRAQNAAMQDVAAVLRSSEQQLAQKTHMLETTLNYMDQGLMMIATDRTVPICNRRAIELLDLPAELMANCPKWEEVLAYQWRENEFVHSGEEFQNFVRRSLLLDGPPVYDRERPDGRILEVRTTPLPGGEAVRTYTDITERKRAEKNVEYLAHHDSLTGLTNRALLNDRLSQALGYAARGGHSPAVLAMDLDRFKMINDTFGHDAGDDILRQVASRLTNAVRAADTVARTGGDEFLVIQTDVAQPIAAAELARRLIEVISQPFEIAGNLVTIGTSIGIAVYPHDGDTPAELLKSADIALYKAKGDGCGTFRMFQSEMGIQLRERRALEHDLRCAVGTDQFELYFQPFLACGTGAITGFEALLRWQHPSRGEVEPASFIPIAEETGIILELGAWVLEQACRAAVSWSEPIRVAVNLSSAQLLGSHLPALVRDVLDRTGLPAHRLELEVTESLLIDDRSQAMNILRELQGSGVRIACDDFGTGYSSFSYLQSLPFERLKIDKSFVQALEATSSARRIIQAILAMAHSLGMDVTAEGVETEEQLTILRAQGCGEIQGFLLGRPLPGDEVLQHLQCAPNAATTFLAEATG